jgi:23S rRNA (adenine2503-C2)-methyltransferase
LHAPDNKLRAQIIPMTTKYPINKILAACDDYIKKTKRQVMFEYLLIKDFNDGEKHALDLVRLMKRELYFVNLITYNSTGKYKPSLPVQISKFKKILFRNKIKVTERYRMGTDIKAACGQLATSIK